MFVVPSQKSSRGAGFLRTAVLLITGLSISGCGGRGTVSSGGPAPQAPNIVIQPVSQSVPMGLSATFTVSALGNPLNYQWSQNGTPIAGATTDEFTTPTTTSADNNSTVTVTISNSLGSVTSTPATLAVTARAPKRGDLRFQQVDAASTVNGYGGGGEGTDFTGYGGDGQNPGIGAPLSIGPGCPATGSDQFGCEWEVSEYGLPEGMTGLSVNYGGFPLGEFSSELSSLSVPTTVVTGLDVEPLSSIFAASWISTTTGGGFDMAQNTVTPSNFQTAASQDGTNSRVITAVSWNSGQISYLSYGWQSDTTTVYDVQTATATIDTVSSVAQRLAAEGYIITAMGGTAAEGILLVGTREHGDSLARSMMVANLAANESPENIYQQGYAVVGFLDIVDSTAGALIAGYWIGER